MSSEPAPYSKAIVHLRRNEEILLYGNLSPISEEDEREVADYLLAEYEGEQLNYPFNAPEFDKGAALWGARTVYIAAQLLLHRQNKDQDLPLLLPDFKHEMTPSAILSADLLLRFLPDILDQLKVIDPDDVLIVLLDGILNKWHYSAGYYTLDYDEIDFRVLEQDKCLMQLYLDRIIRNRNLTLAHHSFFMSRIASDLGMFASLLWKDFVKPEPSSND